VNRDFVWRAIDATLKALDGPRGGTAAMTIARRIDGLRSGSSDSSLSEGHKAMIESGEAWLGPALLEAAENGTLGEIADALKNLRRDGDEVFDRGRYNVLKAYVALLNFGEPPPTLRQVATRLKQRHPKSCIPDERGIRDMLKRLDLPLTADRRGRPSRKKIGKQQPPPTS
jgi:hypothetical protein